MFRLELETPILYNNNQLVYSLELVTPFEDPKDEAFVINDKKPITVAKGKAILCEAVKQLPTNSDIFNNNEALTKLKVVLTRDDEFTSENDFEDYVDTHNVKTYDWGNSIGFNKETLELELFNPNRIVIGEGVNPWRNLSDHLSAFTSSFTLTYSETDTIMRGETRT